MTHGLFPNAVLPDVWISFLGAAWSLSAEWQFYLLALLAGRHGRRLCWILMGLAVAGAAWRLMAPDPWQFSRAFLPNKGHFFALGVASVGVVRLQEAAWRRYWLVFAATLALCATQGALGRVMPPLAWTGLLAIQAAPANGALHAAGALLRSAAARYLGAISYCLYLVNEPVHKIVAPVLARLAGGDGRLFTAMWLPASVGLPIAAAIGLHVWLEAPALRWGRAVAHRFLPDQRAAIVQSRGPGV
jgi:peptidoglycan/LPS O-acetylase OafA/YrhL